MEFHRVGHRLCSMCKLRSKPPASSLSGPLTMALAFGSGPVGETRKRQIWLLSPLMARGLESLAKLTGRMLTFTRHFALLVLLRHPVPLPRGNEKLRCIAASGGH
jgi:hypothetical protein